MSLVYTRVLCSIYLKSRRLHNVTLSFFIFDDTHTQKPGFFRTK